MMSGVARENPVRMAHRIQEGRGGGEGPSLCRVTEGDGQVASHSTRDATIANGAGLNLFGLTLGAPGVTIDAEKLERVISFCKAIQLPYEDEVKAAEAKLIGDDAVGTEAREEGSNNNNPFARRRRWWRR